MTQSEPGTARANRSGDPCPLWCVTDHDEVLHQSETHVLYCDGHRSAPVTAPPAVQVKVFRYTADGGDDEVEIAGGVPLGRLDQLLADDAESLARILSGIEDWDTFNQLVRDLRTAAATARGSK